MARQCHRHGRGKLATSLICQIHPIIGSHLPLHPLSGTAHSRHRIATLDANSAGESQSILLHLVTVILQPAEGTVHRHFESHSCSPNHQTHITTLWCRFMSRSHPISESDHPSALKSSDAVITLLASPSPRMRFTKASPNATNGISAANINEDLISMLTLSGCWFVLWNTSERAPPTWRGSQGQE